jgi:tRNA(adenine34) deaminase
MVEPLNLNGPLDPLERDEYYMRQALREAEAAGEADEVPIGAVVVHQGNIIGRGNNQNKRLQDPTAHAEMIAISAACNQVQSRYLEESTLYVTVEPCSMCAGAIVLARLGRLVFGTTDPKAGACGSVFDLVRDPRLNHQPEVVGGVLHTECAALISGFFEKIRQARK